LNGIFQASKATKKGGFFNDKRVSFNPGFAHVLPIDKQPFGVSVFGGLAMLRHELCQLPFFYAVSGVDLCPR
jgi:hypothetical protein